MKKVTIKLKNNKDFKITSGRLSVIMQAVFMQFLSDETANHLHSQQVNPYSQSIFFSKEEDVYIWQINILKEWLYEEIYDELRLLHNSKIELESIEDAYFKVEEISIETFDQKDMADIFYRSDVNDRLILNFNSSTAFKQDGEYVFYPDIRLIIQSLMIKYNALFEESEIIDQEFLQTLADSVRTTSYNLRSRYFQVHNYNIPGFVGNLRVRIYGNDTIKNYIKMLLMFGEYSGVGIKTSQGMGSFTLNINDR